MRARRLDRGLWRWTAPHPDWRPGAAPGSADHWPRQVGSVLYDAPDAVVLVDPLVPDEPPAWEWLDTRVARRPVHILTTIKWHRRSRDAVAARYGAATSRAKGALPAGVETFVVPRGGETMVWLPGPRALVPGDRLIGDDRAGVRLCPDSWMRYLPSRMDAAGLRAALRPLLDLPVAMVLLSHGEPVLTGARAALAAALGE